MAKQMNSKLPSVENYKGPTVEKPSRLPNPPGNGTAKPIEDVAAAVAQVENAGHPLNVQPVEIELPIGPRSNGYLNNRVNLHLTTHVQQVAMQRLMNGLIESRAVLKDGTKVDCEQHAIRWLLESLPILD